MFRELWTQNQGPQGRRGCGRSPEKGKEPPGKERERERQLGRSSLQHCHGCPSEPPHNTDEGDHVPAYSSIPTEQESGPRAVQRRREMEAQLAKHSDGPAHSAANAPL